ncbi:MAG TPA: arylsulfotransferase family protein, partial [Solirubrobacteraceae bacterium]|nr:arylsulfotransferase family protein [Solirubrobacteraceae bacterium]
MALALLALAGLALWLISPRSGSASAATGVRCVPSHLNVSSSLAGGLVTVSPEPESRDAAAKTQISFLGVAASQLSSISVHGARSGAHGGHLRAYSQGDGASFVLSHALDYGEQVTVHASVANGASTVPFSWSFTTASRDDGGVAGGTPQPRPQSSDYQHFLTRTDLRPPLVAVTAHSPAASSEDLFVAPYSGPGQYGPMILDSSGRLVWFKALPHNTRAADFQVQEYEGKPVLTWWQNPLITGSEKRAGIVIANSAYETIATIRAGNGYQADLHEFLIRPNGTALLTVYNAIDCDLSSVGARSDAAIADTLFEELDLKTGLVRYEWHSLDHVPLSNAYTSARYASERTPYDYFHINSVELQSSGDYLVDSRDTWAAYDVSARTGQVQWELGGKHSSFKEPADAKTAYQHDARRQPDGTITFFDNGATPTVHDQSRAVALRLDEQARTATVVRDFRHPKPLVSGSQGNVQPLANGNWVVGWGEDPWFSEFSPTGE